MDPAVFLHIYPIISAEEDYSRIGTLRPTLSVSLYPNNKEAWEARDAMGGVVIETLASKLRGSFTDDGYGEEEDSNFKLKGFPLNEEDKELPHIHMICTQESLPHKENLDKYGDLKGWKFSEKAAKWVDAVYKASGVNWCI